MLETVVQCCVTTMVSLTGIPGELQLNVFGALNDLDDADTLSQTCRTLRSVFLTWRRPIEKEIIVCRTLRACYSSQLMSIAIFTRVRI